MKNIGMNEYVETRSIDIKLGRSNDSNQWNNHTHSR